MFPSNCGCTPSATAICDHTVPATGITACFVTNVEDLQATANANTETPCSECFKTSTTGYCADDYQSCDASDDIATFTACIGGLNDSCRNECTASCTFAPTIQLTPAPTPNPTAAPTPNPTPALVLIPGTEGGNPPGGGGGESNTIYYLFLSNCSIHTRKCY